MCHISVIVVIKSKSTGVKIVMFNDYVSDFQDEMSVSYTVYK